MELKNIYIGSWFPKMSLHLEEFRNFLLNGAVIDLLEKKTAMELFKKLKPQAVEWGERDSIRFVQAQSGELTIRYFEDGLLTVEKKVLDLKKDFDKVFKFYKNDLSPAMAYLFSKGAKGLELIRVPGTKKPFFVSSLGASKDEITSFFSSQNKKIDSVSSYKELSVNYADELVLININKNGDHSEEEAQSLIENIILFNETGRHLHKLLQIHREIWSKAEVIISKSSTKIKDLPKDSEALTDFVDTVVNIKARIAQIKLNLIYRESTFGNKGGERLLLKFKNRNQDLDYLLSLFEMSNKHLNNNISQLSSIYQEQQHKSLNRLQMLFLTSVVTGFLTLGSFGNMDLTFYGPDQNLLAQGGYDVFDVLTLLKFGGVAVLVTLLIYFFWDALAFKKVKRNPR